MKPLPKSSEETPRSPYHQSGFFFFWSRLPCLRKPSCTYPGLEMTMVRQLLFSWPHMKKTFLEMNRRPRGLEPFRNQSKSKLFKNKKYFAVRCSSLAFLQQSAGVLCMEPWASAHCLTLYKVQSQRSRCLRSRV